MEQAAIAFDQLINCLISLVIGGGWADETWSARCWREGMTDAWWNKWRIVVDLIVFWQRQHCFQSYLSEFERNHLPEEYRK